MVVITPVSGDARWSQGLKGAGRFEGGMQVQEGARAVRGSMDDSAGL